MQESKLPQKRMIVVYGDLHPALPCWPSLNFGPSNGIGLNCRLTLISKSRKLLRNFSAIQDVFLVGTTACGSGARRHDPQGHEVCLRGLRRVRDLAGKAAGGGGCPLSLSLLRIVQAPLGHLITIHSPNVNPCTVVRLTPRHVIANLVLGESGTISKRSLVSGVSAMHRFNPCLGVVEPRDMSRSIVQFSLLF